MLLVLYLMPQKARLAIWSLLIVTDSSHPFLPCLLPSQLTKCTYVSHPRRIVYSMLMAAELARLNRWVLVFLFMVLLKTKYFAIVGNV